MLHHDNYLNRIMQIVCLLLVAICIAIAYSPITRLNFADPDDHWMLLKNEYVHPENYSFAYFSVVMIICCTGSDLGPDYSVSGHLKEAVSAN